LLLPLISLISVVLGLYIFCLLKAKSVGLRKVDIIDSDDVIGVTGEELLTVGGPGDGGTGVRVGSELRFLLLLGLLDDQLSDGILVGVKQVEDVDTVLTSGGNPLDGGVESDLVDGRTGVQDVVLFLQVRDVPDLEVVLLTTSGDVVTLGGDVDGVDVVLMCLEGVLDQEVGLPDLQSTVPTGGGEVRVLLDGGVLDARDPIGVVVGLVGVLAISQSVPELEGSVSRSRDNLSVVAGEGDGVDFLGVTGEDLGGSAGSKVPESQGLVPRSRQAEHVVVRDGDVRNEVVVAGEGLQGDTVKLVGVALIVSVVITGKLPDHDGLVS